MASPKPLVVKGYVIPNPSSSIFLILSVIAMIFVMIGYSFFGIGGGIIGLFLGIGFFHLRNHVVREEVEQGLHDSTWGTHLMRMRQRDWDRHAKPLTKKIIVIMVVAMIVIFALNMAGFKFPFINQAKQMAGPVEFTQR
ncbi:hypothetical protein [Chromobacterium vaccinii]|uniref:hypothetical protein n=1 Tax=Chromobacterium vaccinii TaxID=1108595 RepID=UPI00345AA7A5